MTNKHPATPTSQEIDKFFMLPLCEEERLAAAFCAGADQELEACIAELHTNVLTGAFYVGGDDTPSWHHFALKVIDKLRAARRPRPLSLREQALSDLSEIGSHYIGPGTAQRIDTIRRALEALPDD